MAILLSLPLCAQRGGPSRGPATHVVQSHATLSPQAAGQGQGKTMSTGGIIGAAAARASNQENLTKSGPAAVQVAQNPKQAAGEWLRKHKDLSSSQQEMLLENDPGFQRLPRERQQQMKEHLREFNNMPQEQRQRWIDRMDALEKLSPQQKETLERSVVQLRNMPEPRRNTVRRALAQLAQIPEEERTKVLESDRFKQAFSPEERSMMKNLFDAGIRPNGMPIEPK